MKAKDGEKKKAGASCAHKALKLSAKARYALRALIDIASCDAGGSPRTGAAISKTQQVSEKFLSRIVTELRDAGVLRSVRGNVGGFRLAKPPDDITLLEVVEAVQGPVMILDCLSAGGRCSRQASCLARCVWEDVNATLRTTLKKMTLASILRRDAKTAQIVDFCI